MNNIIFNIYDEIFIDNEKSIEFLNQLGVFRNIIECERCGNMSKVMKRDVSRLNSYFYFFKICRIKTHFTQKTLRHGFKKPLFIFLRYVYAFSANFDCCQVE
ncbi:hypothetical protein DMUE_5172, partial [Dictyocoela muelleri]